MLRYYITGAESVKEAPLPCNNISISSPAGAGACQRSAPQRLILTQAPRLFSVNRLKSHAAKHHDLTPQTSQSHLTSQNIEYTAHSAQ